MFWTTPLTFKELYGKDYVSVKMFSLPHIIELAVLLIASIIIFKLFKKANKKKRHKIFVILTILLLLDEVIKHVATALTNQWVWNYLPLHLCSINIFICSIYTFKPTKLLRSIIYGLCLPGALVAMIIATWNVAPVWNLMHLHSYTVHCLLVIYSILVLAEGYKPDYKMIPKMLLFLIIVLIPIYFINIKLNTNFFFINDPYDNAATKFLTSIFTEKYYLFGMLILLVILWSIMYLPFSLKKKVN